MDPLPSYARAIKEQRDRRGMSRSQLAEASELSYPYISQLETGLRKPSRNAARAIASALGISVEDLERTIPSDLKDPRDVLEAEEFTERFLTGEPPAQYVTALRAPGADRGSGAESRGELIGDMIDLLEEFDPEDRLDVLGEVQKLAMRRMLDQERSQG